MSTALLSPVTPQPLSLDAFAPFGEVITYAAISGRHVIDAAFDIADTAAHPRLWINSLPASDGTPVVITMLERHPLSAQTFIPLTGGPCLSVVAASLPDGQPDFDSLVAFVVPCGLGVCYRRGTWHAGFSSIREAGHVAVIQAMTDESRDTELVPLPSPRTISLP